MPVKRKAASKELAWIQWLRRLEEGGPRGSPRARRSRGQPGLLGIGDDAAVWTPARGKSAVLTVDAQVEGVHFHRRWTTLRQIGRRAVASSVSDLAAMAASPAALLVAITAPDGTADRDFRELYHGIHSGAAELGARVLGGNLSAGPLSITITAIGEGDPRKLLVRSGADAGDEIWVTGAPGLARLGLAWLERRGAQALPESPSDRAAIHAALRAFLAPTARCREAAEIARSVAPTSMIDLSDGLAADLGHILDESGVRRGKTLGAEISAPALAESPILGRAAALLGQDPAGAALEGGDDYELCFTAPPGAGARLASRYARRFGHALTRIGRLVSRSGLWLEGEDGKVRRTRAGGYSHFRRRPR
jgi:thiamine-monophosphate kinase